MASHPFKVTVHPFPSPTSHSCAYERGTSSRNALVFIGGLTSGPHTSPQLNTLVQALDSSSLEYSLWEFRMRSSYTGFGYSSLANDAEDIAAIVSYLKSIGKVNIVLLGSSSGCQAILTYTSTPNHPPVAGYILQAPTSDRETASLIMPPELLKESLSHAQTLTSQNTPTTPMPPHLLPPIFTSPITAYRWSSLVSPNGDDDFFSSDLPDSTLTQKFRTLDRPTLILPSENDEMVPPSVDKAGLLERWKRAAGERTVSELSGVNPGADHGLSEGYMQEWVWGRVIRFLEGLIV